MFQTNSFPQNENSNCIIFPLSGRCEAKKRRGHTYPCACGLSEKDGHSKRPFFYFRPLFRPPFIPYLKRKRRKIAKVKVFLYILTEDLRGVNIMKRIVMLFIAVFMLAGFSACTTSKAADPPAGATLEAPTGYAKSEVQRVCLFYNGTLYYDLETTLTLPESTHQIGEIVSNDDFTIPSEQFAAAHLKVGDHVYASDPTKELYVMHGTRYVIMTPAVEE